MKPFNLDEALAGKPVVTRDGRPVKIAGYNEDADSEFFVVGWKDGITYSWCKDGSYTAEREHRLDLFMAPTTRKEWIVRCPEYTVYGPYHTPELAQAWINQMKRPDATIHEITITE